ncbi:acetyl-CoA carboxylase biotin carboxyl carrier protein [Micromonospora sp. A200]|uniref:acetyl-CoA carboxylase biotin carboxyl carrier protein n=1 Tax=Micromonospora sp. A200 TaxID=2940568 RepID=UPI00247410D1|nr:biotin/lipoyl-containing protein [Micromonospora sp. A200]MDH6460755.1 acetyl-CoA carboxylase biotin carboxyl carrier protein [Micromonospora sp. A200]
MTSDTTRAPHRPPEETPDDHDPRAMRDMQAALELVRSSTLELLTGFGRTPSALRVRAGGVTVEAEWPVEPTTAHAATDAPVPVAPGSTPVAVEPDGHQVRSPAVGVLFHAPSPGAPPFVSVGDTVAPGQQLAIVEVMKLMIPVECTVHGTVSAVLHDNGEPVEYDDPLFLINVTDGS